MSGIFWGRNSDGELGLDDDANRSSPNQVGSDDWDLVAPGYKYMLGIKSDGTLWSWGNNNLGQLGDGTTVNKSSPVQIGTSSWTAVAAGGSQVVALRSDGGLFAWGNGAF